MLNFNFRNLIIINKIIYRLIFKIKNVLYDLKVKVNDFIENKKIIFKNILLL